jgi:hypothetical protein
MVRSVEGIYRNGKVELLEAAPAVGEARVIVTFLPVNGDSGAAGKGTVDLATRQIDPQHASSLRARLKSFEDDWQRPEMDAYDAI